MNNFKLILIFASSLLLTPFFETKAQEIDNIILQPIDTIGNRYTPIQWNNIESFKILSTEDGDSLRIINTDSEDMVFDMSKTLIMNGNTIPLITITTDSMMNQIPDKVNYQKATIEIKGFGVFEDFSQEVSIRGRGNTSWVISDKKPYRLKFDKKQSLCGLKKAKNFVLLANWTDISLIQNSLASFIGKMLNLPYTHTMVPVDVVLNGVYRGSYILTNKPGINAGSVDIDEDTSVMWELDTYFDEDMKFKSPLLDLPVNLADPDLTEERFEYWKNDFITMEENVVNGNVEDYIDIDSYAKYKAVNEIMKNNELWHPKSLKMYKEEGGKYQFGPLWDFDVAMGYNYDKRESYNILRAASGIANNNLMKAIEKDNKVNEKIFEYINFVLKNEDELWKFIDSYCSDIKSSALRNNIKWKSFGDWEENIAKMKIWFEVYLGFLKTKYKLNPSK